MQNSDFLFQLYQFLSIKEILSVLVSGIHSGFTSEQLLQRIQERISQMHSFLRSYFVNFKPSIGSKNTACLGFELWPAWHPGFENQPVCMLAQDIWSERSSRRYLGWMSRWVSSYTRKAGRDGTGSFYSHWKSSMLFSPYLGEVNNCISPGTADLTCSLYYSY